MALKFLICLVGSLNLAVVQLIAQPLNIKIVPSIGAGEGLYQYSQKVDKNYISSIKTNYNPLSPVDIQFGIASEISLKNSIIIGLGITNGISSYSYRVFMGRDEKIDTLPSGDIRKTITTTYNGTERNRPTIKIPFYISFPIMAADNKSIPDSVALHSSYEKYKASKIKIRPNFIIGLSVIKLKKQGSYSDIDNYYENYPNSDTIVFYSYHTDKNKWGGSLDIGLSLNFRRNNKTLFRFNLKYEQGIIPLFEQHLIYTRNRAIEYKNDIITRGSQVYFGFSFPLTIYTDR